ncbi:BACON domain-containing protein [Ktedonospora formicarum]|uniref:BACON domain-containing protein n=1 Tax=Ktedonospora formicarum TaxID=2778364 RepID=A0A8J3HU73_9CHLR|nr:hypothetical protein [Ktedonospora formicarum]GHO43356.1 hypothetical protein KSX_15190 [Ktedonospora formicarum]
MISWVASSDRPWLLLTPMQGAFSSGQTVLLVASRAGLKPGDYTGTILLVASTGSSQKVTVKMSVRPLPDDPGPVLSMTPAAFSFTGLDGVADPAEQMLVVSNLGNKPLHWSLASQVQMASLSEVMGFQTHLDWLSIQPTQGTIEPGKTQLVHLRVKSKSLLSDVYSGIVALQADQKTLNNPQSLALSLSVRPPCSVSTSSEHLALHASAGQPKSAPQNLDLSVAPSCKGKIDWQASSQNDWLHVTPAKGTLSSRDSADLVVQIDASRLKPGTYVGSLVIVAAQSSQTISVQAVVSPIGEQSKIAGLTLSPSQLAFDIVQGQNSGVEQNVVIANTGQADLMLHATGGVPWLQVDTHEIALNAGTTADVPVHVNAGSLAPGSYNAQVLLSATDEAGNAIADAVQTLTVSLNVRQPCVMAISPSSLSFKSSLLDSSPSSQTISISATGACSYPVTWNVSADEQWIVLGSSTWVDNGGGTQLTVNVNTKWKILGTYQGHITFVAYDSRGATINQSPQIIPVTLHVNS